MSNVTDEFTDKDKRADFLSQHVIFVANVAEMDNLGNKAGTRNVYFWKVTDSVVELREDRFGRVQKKIKAYWLPWKTLKAVAMDMGDDAQYFFTSQMTGCRFSVLTKEGAPVKVAHIAGTLSQPKRSAEEDKLVTQMGGPEQVRARSLSVSGASEHGYSGQTADPGSAFVYGVFEDGAWHFGAQIVGENLLPTADLKGILSSAIKPAFSFDT